MHPGNTDWIIQTYPVLESTNDFCRGLLDNEDVNEGTVVRAVIQRKGRGQGNNSWYGGKGENLTFSIILRPRFLSPANQFMLSMLASLAISRFLDIYTSGVRIKWPNDIFAGDKKIAGILIENSVMNNRIESSVVGIGLNINQELPGSHLPGAVSLRQLTGSIFDLDECLDLLLLKVDRLYAMLSEGRDEIIKQMYKERLYLLDSEGVYRSEGTVFSAFLRGVDNMGRLVLEKTDGEKICYSMQEVEFIRPAD
ncbi:MAG: biotin--[acetyl-CoA-carboxylase] ligase [Marinilabiliales bacterium]|nr:MAG: biotin--[acetyl-CoA-carboxylase] ligase [Marinilabiliales bacterium]